VQHEHCVIHSEILGAAPASYDVRSGRVHSCSLTSAPAAAIDRLFLVAVSGQPEFRPLFDALQRLGLYNFNPDVIRELQSPDPGEVLASDGRNLASVLKRLSEPAEERGHGRVLDLLSKVVPGITGVSHRSVGKKETLEFRQIVAGSQDAWRFDAENMSDGTLRALGVLVALFQPPASDGRAVRLVGIEEPEAALHPGAAAVLRSALFEASRHTQVIVTSHSPDLLDDKQVSADTLFSVTNRFGETVLGPVDEASRSSIRDHLFTAGELLRLNQIETDESAFAPTGGTQFELFDRP
jgi:predicted ATPase